MHTLLSQFPVLSVPTWLGYPLVAQKKWVDAIQRRQKTLEFRLHGSQWMKNRLGTRGVFVYSYGKFRMPFMFPKKHQKELYGSFATLALFWENFHASPIWAQQFYTRDGVGDAGLDVFMDFMAKHAHDHTGQCVWFSPLPCPPVHELLGKTCL